MTDWMISVVVDDQEADISEVRRLLADCLRANGVRPRFRTVVAWLVDSTEALKGQPEPVPSGGYESEHTGTIRQSRGFVRE